MKTPIILITTAVLSSGLLHTYVQANDNDYYSNDLDAAVSNAEASPNNDEYVGNRWFNRTTSKSFNFPKMMNKELSTEVVDGALDATAAGPGEAAPSRTSPLELKESDVAISKKDVAEIEQLATADAKKVELSAQPKATISDLQPNVYKLEKIEYRGEGFSGSARNIRSEAHSKAYLTP